LSMRGQQGRTIYLSILVGLKEQYPQISLGDYLGASALERLDNVYYESIETIENAYADIPDDEFGPRNELARRQFRAWLQAIAVPRQYFDTPVFCGGRSRPNGPGTDRVVPHAGAGRVAGRLTSPPGYDRCIDLGLKAVFRLDYEASSHQEMLPAAASDVVEWMHGLLLESGAPSSGKD
jgi:hypothetical protein